ncbi:S8 family serine peptidase [Cytobacillus sp. FSL K6-0129]|uniref:S8 family serine peptidase n=1 Tax=Cytobacillus sp. FSL K6-0129 TaxID=2921421 RepID=UPI0030F83020
MKRKRKNGWFRLVSMAMIAFLIVPMMFPSISSASNKGVNTSVAKSASEVAENKISKTLTKEFKKEEQVTFLVKFKEKADPQKSAQKAEKAAAAQKQSAAQAKYMKRSAIVSDMRTVAIESQDTVLSYLEKQEKKGNAKEVQSFFIVNAVAVTATKDVMEQLATFPEVEKILPNETRKLHTPTVEEQAKAEEAGKINNIEWNIDHIGAPAVWEMGIDGSGTVVASIDTGVQWNHPALKEKYRGYDPANPESPDHEYNFFDAVSGNEESYDDHGHGTHVTGTMVGSEPDGGNQIGVAPGAEWIAAKALDAGGSGSDAQLIAAGEWILAPTDAEGNPNPAMAPDVVNNSWGGGPGIDDWYREVVQAWRAAEIFPEFSAGNTTLFNPGGPGSVANPGNLPEAYTTGATDINDNLGSFSLLGPSPYGGIIKPDISAPGVNIRSSVPGSGYEGGWNGTSMAGPHVAAVAALLRQVNASLTVEDMEEIISSTAIPLTNETYTEVPNNGFGNGLVNAYDAVNSILDGLGTIKGTVAKDGEDEEAPTVEHEAIEETYAGMDLPLEVSAADNVSVTNVTVEYTAADGSTKTVTAARDSGDYKSGTYSTVIPGDDIAEPSVSYKFIVTDFGGNTVESDMYEVSVLPGITVGYSTDFESTPAGWTSSGAANNWEWGVPTTGPESAFSGEKVFATGLDSQYASNANMTLVMPPIDLPEGNSFLQFKQWYNIENNYDYGHVFVSTDQENWTQLARYTNLSNDWVDGQVDLSEYAGQRIYIGFNLTTDGSVTRPGWYIDDVALTDTPLETAKTGKVTLEKKDAKTEAKKDAKPVNADKIQPNTENATVEKGSDKKATPMSLPLGAKVSVLESGRSVNTNPADGSYQLVHAAGEFTLLAETYGFASETQTVNVEADGEAVANFVLDELPQGTINGSVTNERTGEPITGATILLVEDAKVTPVTTDENGNYSITAYEGEYTLRVMANSYSSKDVTVTLDEENVEVNIELKPFIGFEGEIGYDDGTAENARAFYDAGNGWGVRMSLEEGQESAMVTGGLFRFWDTSFPTPGGTDFQVAIYDATDNGTPGEKLAGPIDATALRNGEWTHVDLATEGVTVDGDFFMVYIQTDPNPNAPGLGTDENGDNAGRSFQLVGGAWSASPAAEGNYMIRAVVNYELTSPTITSPADGSYTNEETVTVEGSTQPNVDVKVYNGDEEAGTTTASAEGEFSLDVELNEGENVLTATGVSEVGETDPSEPVTIILDQEAPALAITSPEDGSKTNKETVTVEGTVSDDHLDTVTVNGQNANVSDGTFSKRILLDEGTNEITVVATDEAGNTSTETVTIEAKYSSLDIENLQPGEDRELAAGQTVKIEFDSEPGLKATFALKMPLTNLRAQTTNVNDLPIMETSPGHYVGYYTATSNVVAPGAEIEVTVKDSFGNKATEIAEGKLYINAPID